MKKNISTDTPQTLIETNEQDNYGISNIELENLTDDYSSKEKVIDALKFVLKKKTNCTKKFISYLESKDKENEENKKEFIKEKCSQFIDSVINLEDCESLIKETQDYLKGPESIQQYLNDYLEEFNINFIDKIKAKERLENMILEKEKLNTIYVFFAYMHKCDNMIKENQFELAVKLINTAHDKLLKKFPIKSSIYIKGIEIIDLLKKKISSILQEKLINWLNDVNIEQQKIGESLYKKIKNLSEINKDFAEYRTQPRKKERFADSVIMIRNSSNFNYMKNRSSVIRQSVLNEDKEEEIAYDIISMVSNIDFKFLENTYDLYKDKKYFESNFLNVFTSFRQDQLVQILEINGDKSNLTSFYEKYLSNLLGFIIVQVSIYKLFDKKYFPNNTYEEKMNFLANEFETNILNEFKSFKLPVKFYDDEGDTENKSEELTIDKDLIDEGKNINKIEKIRIKNYLKIKSDLINNYRILEKSLFIFQFSIEKIGDTENMGKIKNFLNHIKEEIANLLNDIIIRIYQKIFLQLIVDDLCKDCLVVNSPYDLNRYATQYGIKVPDTKLKSYSLYYTMLVVNVNQYVKRYIDEIFRFIKPLYTEYDDIMPSLLRVFLFKMREVFLNFSEENQELHIVNKAKISNNIKYISESHNYYIDYMKKLCNIKSDIIIDSKFDKASELYDGSVTEGIKNKIISILSDLSIKNYLPIIPDDENENYVDAEVLISFLNVIYSNLQDYSIDYISIQFRGALDDFPKIFIDIFYESNVKFNIYAIYKLKKEIDEVDKYFQSINNAFKESKFDVIMEPLRAFFEFFETKDFNKFKNRNDACSNKIELNKFFDIIQRYKNLKRSEMRGKITENDIHNIVRSYNNEKNEK